jgi:hypothetical protein
MLTLRTILPTLIALRVLTAIVAANALAADETTQSFNPRKVVPPMSAIVDAPTLAADDVDDQVSDNELVLGVALGDRARAYPINMLTGPRREIINDTLGGSAIAATW